MGRFSAAMANTSPLPFSRQKSANPGNSWAKPYAATSVAAYPQTKDHIHTFLVCVYLSSLGVHALSLNMCIRAQIDCAYRLKYFPHTVYYMAAHNQKADRDIRRKEPLDHPRWYVNM